MPNRIIREGFLDSEAVARAGELAQVLFVRLLLVADDFGRFDGRLEVIIRKCWPAGGPGERENPQQFAADVASRLRALSKENLVIQYNVDGKPYLFIPNFRQRSRASKSKFPPPPELNQPVDNPVDNSDLSTDDPPQPVDNSVSDHSHAPKSPIELNPSLINNLSNDGQMTDEGQTGGIHPRTYSYSNSNALRAHAREGNSNSKPAAHSTAAAAQTIAEGRQAEANKAPPPPHLADLIERTRKALEAK